MRATAWGGARGPAARFGLLLAAVLSSGCGAGPVKVSGRVLYDGAPLPGGWVTFRPADPRQNAVSAQIDAAGNYAAVLPAGDVQACVDNRDLAPRQAAPGPAGMPPELTKAIQDAGGQAAPGPTGASVQQPAALSGKYVEIPARYYEAETSGISFTVSPATKQHDIVLTK